MVVARGLFPLFLPPPAHEPKADEDEGDAQELAHVQEHAALEVHLVLLGVFDEDAAREDEREAEPEEEARAHAGGAAAVEPPADDEEEGVAQGLVELSGMAREQVHPLEYEGPGHVRGAADDLAVHQVAQADGCGADGGDDGDVVQDHEVGQPRLAHEEPQGDDEAQRAAVAGQALVAREVPAARGVGAEGEEHLQRMGQVVGRLVEEAVAQTGADEDAQEAVEEEGLELLLGDALLPVEAVLQQVDGERNTIYRLL